MSATTSSAVIARINDLNGREDYEGIIQFIEGLAPEDRTSEVIGQLARAYNNLAQAGETAPFEKALRLLDSIPPSDRENHYWHFRRAYALFFLDRTIESLTHWKKALAYKPDDEDTKQFIEWSLQQLSAEIFFHPFRDRIADAWEQFSKSEADLRRQCREGAMGLQMARDAVEKMFKPVASDKWLIELGQDDEKARLTLSPRGWRLTAFPLREFLRHAPAALKDRWTFEFGVQAGHCPSEVECHVGPRRLRSSELTVVPEQAQDGETRFVFSGPELAAIEEDELPELFEALEWMIRKVVGESVQSRWFSSLGIYRSSPAEKGVTLAALGRYVQEHHPEAEGFTMDDYLDLETEIIKQPEADPDCDLLLDAVRLTTKCPALHNGYNGNDAGGMIELERQGINAGIFYFTASPDAAEEDKRRLRETLAAFLQAPGRRNAFLLTGFGSALRYEYVEGFLWDSKAVFDQLAGWFASQPQIVKAAFHSFLRTSASCIFKSPETADADVKETDASGT